MSISPRSTGGPTTDDPSWLYSDHGANTNLSATLDVSAFTEATHYPDGFIPSGTPLGKIDGSGLYGPYDDAAVDGTETLVGFLYAPVEVVDATFGAATTVGGAVYQHGVVVEANLPIAIDAAGKADVAGSIKFV